MPPSMSASLATPVRRLLSSPPLLVLPSRPATAFSQASRRRQTPAAWRTIGQSRAASSANSKSGSNSDASSSRPRDGVKTNSKAKTKASSSSSGPSPDGKPTPATTSTSEPTGSAAENPAESATDPNQKSNPILADYLSKYPQGKPLTPEEQAKQMQQQAAQARENMVQGDLGETSIFEDQRRSDAQEKEAEGKETEVSETPTLSPLQNPYRQHVLDPDPGSRERWERKKVIQSIRLRGRLSREELLARTERVHRTKSNSLKTSVKKLGMLARQIAGTTLDHALLQMRFSKKKVAREVLKQLELARDEAIVSRGMGLGLDARNQPLPGSALTGATAAAAGTGAVPNTSGLVPGSDFDAAALPFPGSDSAADAAATGGPAATEPRTDVDAAVAENAQNTAGAAATTKDTQHHVGVVEDENAQNNINTAAAQDAQNSVDATEIQAAQSTVDGPMTANTQNNIGAGDSLLTLDGSTSNTPIPGESPATLEGSANNTQTSDNNLLVTDSNINNTPALDGNLSTAETASSNELTASELIASSLTTPPTASASESKSTANPIKIELKNGKRHTVTDMSRIYIDQAWVGRAKYGRVVEARARGRANMLRPPYTQLSLVLKEETTRVREWREREAKRRKKRLEHVWTQLQDKNIHSHRQYYSW